MSTNYKFYTNIQIIRGNGCFSVRKFVPPLYYYLCGRDPAKGGDKEFVIREILSWESSKIIK